MGGWLMGRVLRLLVTPLLLAVLLVTLVQAAGDSAVTKAVKAGDVAAVRKLIASKADVNAVSGDGSVPLLWAAYNSDTEMAKALVAAGAKVDVANNYGVTPLLQASRTGDAAMMDVLLKAGADPKKTHPEGETPLMAASRSGNIAAVKLLLDRGVDVNAEDSFQNQTALMWAAAEDQGEVVDLLLKAGADPNKKARLTTLTERRNSDFPTGGFTALMWAARNGHEDTVRRLAKGGADLTVKNGDGATATSVAIWNDRFDMAAVLVELGADVNDGSLFTAVKMRESTTDQFAFDGSRLRPDNPNKLTNLDLVKLLLERGADPNKNFSGQYHSTSMPNGERFDNTPFYQAAVMSDVESLKLLIAHGANLDQTPVAPPPPAEGAPAPAAGGRGRGGNPNAGRSATMVTMTGGRGPGMTGGPGYIRSGDTVPWREPGSRKPLDAFTVLIKAGANPNAKSPDGNTLLHQVAQARNLDMIRVLAEAKVDFNQTNNDGLTALDVAEGKQPANAPAGGRGARGAGPPAGGGRGRGGAPAGPTQQDVAKLLRELMGLPPAPPPAPAAEAADPNAIPAPPGGRGARGGGQRGQRGGAEQQ
jgi:ankyrin repeat protein